MVGRFFAGLGNVLVAILKAIAWLMLNEGKIQRVVIC